MLQFARLWSPYTGGPSARIFRLSRWILATLQSRDGPAESLRLSLVERSVPVAIPRLFVIDTVAGPRGGRRPSAETFLEGDSSIFRHVEGAGRDFYAATHVVLDAIISDARTPPSDLLQSFEKYTKEDAI